MEYALYDLSYANLVLFNATLPVYHPAKGKADGKAGLDRNGKPHKVIKADDPANAEALRQFLSEAV